MAAKSRWFLSLMQALDGEATTFEQARFDHCHFTDTWLAERQDFYLISDWVYFPLFLAIIRVEFNWVRVAQCYIYCCFKGQPEINP